MKCIKNKISGVCVGVMVSAAFIVMVFGMHVVGTTQWTVLANPVTEKADVSNAVSAAYQLALEDESTTGLSACTPEAQSCNVAELIRTMTE